MGMKEASAMTEASGLVDDQAAIESTSCRVSRADMGRSERRRGSSHQSAPERPAPRVSDQLREMTMRAPLQALSIAFLLGVMVARRR